VPPAKQHPRGDHNLYKTLSDGNTRAADAELSLLHIHLGFSIFQDIPSVMRDIPKPDLLHTMQIGMHYHFQKWIFHFMKTHKPFNKYNAIWLSMLAYHHFTPKNQPYEEVSQLNGNEIKEMS